MMMIIIVEIVTEFYEIHCRKSSHIKEIQAEIETFIGRGTETSMDIVYYPYYKEVNSLIYSFKKTSFEGRLQEPF